MLYLYVFAGFLFGTLLGALGCKIFLSRSYSGRLKELEERLQVEKEGRIRAEAQLESLKGMEDGMMTAFKALSAEVMDKTYSTFLERAGETLGRIIAEAKADMVDREKNIESLVSPMKELLDRLNQKLVEMEREREGAFRSLVAQIGELSRRSDELRKETERLYSALKKPQVRGRWGELTLKNAVELAGLSQYCDFQEQVRLHSDTGGIRPDMVIRLPGGRFIAVDAKVPVDHFFEALEVDDTHQKRQALEKHVASLRSHMRALGSKGYWKGLERSPDFVVMFIPADSFLSVALEVDRSLIEDGLKEGVIVATPTLLIALLKVVALTWREAKLTEEMREMANIGRELFRRASTFVDNMAKLGKSIASTVEAYNRAVGSWEGRLAPQLRRFSRFDASGELKELGQVDKVVRELRGEG